MNALTLAFFNMGPSEWVIILILALLLFGRRLPEVMRNLGRGVVEFKRGVRGLEDEIDEEASKPPPPTSPETPQVTSPQTQGQHESSPPSEAPREQPQSGSTTQQQS